MSRFPSTDHVFFVTAVGVRSVTRHWKSDGINSHQLL